MKIVGCDLHAKQQTIAMVDTDTGELIQRTLSHEGNAVREFYAALEGAVVVGIEATQSMQWFLELLDEMGIECRVGHPAKIRAAETRKQKHDRRDARLILDLLTMEDRFPAIWMPSTEQRDLRTLLRDRHQWVKIRSRLQHTLQAIALNHALRQGHGLWSAAGQSALGPCLCRLIPVKDEMSYSVCTRKCRNGSKSWIKKWKPRPDDGHRRAGC
jgi:transposase